MKNLVIISFFLIASISWAQEPEKEVKSADKKYGLYNLDTKGNASKLWEAKAIIDAVSTNPAVSEQHKTWITKGKIYNAIAATQNDSLVIAQTMKKDAKLTFPNSGVDAYNALTKALSTSVKSFEKKDALEAIQETSQFLNNFGYYQYKAGDFNSAFQNFNAVILIEKDMKANNMKSVFTKEADYNNQLYIASLCAMNDKKIKEVLPYLEELSAKNFNDENNAGASIYEGLFEYYQAIDEAKASSILSEGRQKYPEVSSLLFQEINFFLKKGKLNELIDKLKLAISKEKSNVSLYSTLGNVYDNLCQKEWEAGNMAKGDEYYNEGIMQYSEALKIEPDNFNALYSLGACYYNKAAQISKEMNKLSNDYSKEGTRKYDAKKAEMESYFDKALPNFESAEKKDPKDKNTIIALKEIYAKKGNIQKASEYKAKLEGLK
ncbi:MAG: hypothetical protein WBB17_08770 [Saprospiraceae bacterium]|jgi:hypothetical protein